jgi:8-oxo-dGTP pyrophosphatase MutT (NUDIX family)
MKRESDVVAALLVRPDGRVLLVQRSEGRPVMGGLWSAVSGYIEAGETPFEAAAREVREETGLHITPERAGEPFRVELETQVIVVHSVLARVPAGVQITLDRENQAYRWVEPRDVYDLPRVLQLEDDFVALGLLPG